MNEAWSLANNIAGVIGMFLVPIIGWVLWTLISHGKQIIVLEQRVNDSLNQRMKSIEKRVVGVEEKVDQINENITECKIVMNDNKAIHKQINQKFDALINKMDGRGY
tara:strand:+ start:5865 stop:6185 length:321 start_codon:yes stop_codon:yes gene_type:complete